MGVNNDSIAVSNVTRLTLGALKTIKFNSETRNHTMNQLSYASMFCILCIASTKASSVGSHDSVESKRPLPPRRQTKLVELPARRNSAVTVGLPDRKDSAQATALPRMTPKARISLREADLVQDYQAVLKKYQTMAYQAGKDAAQRMLRGRLQKACITYLKSKSPTDRKTAAKNLQSMRITYNCILPDDDLTATDVVKATTENFETNNLRRRPMHPIMF